MITDQVTNNQRYRFKGAIGVRIDGTIGPGTVGHRRGCAGTVGSTETDDMMTRITVVTATIVTNAGGTLSTIINSGHRWTMQDIIRHKCITWTEGEQHGAAVTMEKEMAIITESAKDITLMTHTDIPLQHMITEIGVEQRTETSTIIVEPVAVAVTRMTTAESG